MDLSIKIILIYLDVDLEIEVLGYGILLNIEINFAAPTFGIIEIKKKF